MNNAALFPPSDCASRPRPRPSSHYSSGRAGRMLVLTRRQPARKLIMPLSPLLHSPWPTDVPIRREQTHNQNKHLTIPHGRSCGSCHLVSLEIAPQSQPYLSLSVTGQKKKKIITIVVRESQRRKRRGSLIRSRCPGLAAPLMQEPVVQHTCSHPST